MNHASLASLRAKSPTLAHVGNEPDFSGLIWGGTALAGLGLGGLLLFLGHPVLGASAAVVGAAPLGYKLYKKYEAEQHPPAAAVPQKAP
jgi:uncharacterized membrane protein YebE (DUF533 family)